MHYNARQLNSPRYPQFWVSFYEQAAQTRLPTSDDYSTVNDDPSLHLPEEESASEQENTLRNHASVDERTPQDEETQDSIISSTDTEDSSFMPGHAAFSSTPATQRVLNADDQSAASWNASMESPFMRLDREVKSLSIDTLSEEDSSAFDYTAMPASPSPSRSIKGKGKADNPKPLLRAVLKHNLYTHGDTTISSASPSFNNTSPLRPKSKTPNAAKNLNPYLPSGTQPSEWSGLVDLKDPSVIAATPKRYRYQSKIATPALQLDNPDDGNDSDNSWELPPGMSPPRMMSPARLPPSAKLGKTPAKEAAARITRDIVSDFRRRPVIGGDIVESSMSTMATPPSLSRYRSPETTESGIDTSLEGLMRRVGLATAQGNIPSTYASTSVPSRRIPSPVLPHKMQTPPQNFNEDGFDDDSFENDDVGGSIAQPSAAFLMASSHRPSGDDSFDSFGSSNDSGDSMLSTEHLELEGALIHPFARPVSEADFEDEDDSFDLNHPGDGGGGHTDTVFGNPRAHPQDTMLGPGQFQLHGLRVLDNDTATSTEGPDSPTPYGR